MRNEDCGYADELDELIQDDPENYPQRSEVAPEESECEERATSLGEPFGAR